MAVEMSYVIITPYTIAKSRTGGVFARLLSRLDLSLVAAQMFAPDETLAEAYAAQMLKNKVRMTPGSAELLHDYILRTFSPTDGHRHRVMMLIFQGEDACRKLRDIVGALFPEHRGIESITGETIRDTYADLVFSQEDPKKVTYFEPAVLTPPDADTAEENLKLFIDFIDKQPNLVTSSIHTGNAANERTLVIIKPDNWHHASTRPGNVIDMFSRTGLRIVGCKIHKMSMEDALEFYGPVKEILREKLSPMFGSKARAVLEREFGMEFPESLNQQIVDTVGVHLAEDQFYQIVDFMSGHRPDKDPEDARQVKCMVLIYEGPDAVNKIREVLGPTDPSKAPGGTIRRDFGTNVMVNTAHASDSPENAKREMRIVRIEDNPLCRLVTDHLS